MTVDPTKSRGGSFDYDGTTYYFCSPGCRTKFEADPARWLKSGPSGMAHSTRAQGARSGQGAPVTLKRVEAPQHAGMSAAADVSPPAPPQVSAGASEHESTSMWT